jgi:hypothetical protein
MGVMLATAVVAGDRQTAQDSIVAGSDNDCDTTVPAGDDLVVRVEGRSLMLEAPLRLGQAESLAFVYSEFRANRYRRSFELSGELDTTAIQADLKDGVLKLRLPKIERAQPRRVEVRAAA